jgi:hypothetical protein
MVAISSSGSGEGPGWVTAPGYSTAAFLENVRVGVLCQLPCGAHGGHTLGQASWPARRSRIPASQ